MADPWADAADAWYDLAVAMTNAVFAVWGPVIEAQWTETSVPAVDQTIASIGPLTAATPLHPTAFTNEEGLAIDRQHCTCEPAGVPAAQREQVVLSVARPAGTTTGFYTGSILSGAGVPVATGVQVYVVGDD